MKGKAAGDWGEALVAQYLQERGAVLLARGYRSRFGEIDLIVQQGKVLCFIEVKLRSSTVFGQPREYVGAAKQRRLRCTAEQYLHSHDPDVPARFDVAEVFYDRDRNQARVAYHENAF